MIRVLYQILHVLFSLTYVRNMTMRRSRPDPVQMIIAANKNRFFITKNKNMK